MSDFQLSENADSNKIFITKFSELEGRWNPSSYSMKSIFADSVFPIKLLRDFFIVNPLQKEKIKANIDYSFIPMKNISDKNAVVKQTNIIKGKDSKGYTSFNDGDFVFAKITPCMENGKMAIIRNLPTHIGFGSTEFHVFREKTNAVTVDFLRSIFLINDFRKYAKCYFTGTAGHQRVPSEFFQSLKIPIPPKNIQADIVAKMDRAYQDKQSKETQAQNLLNSIDDYLLDELGIDFPKQTDNSLKARIFTKKLSEVVGGRFDAEYYKNKYIDFENSLIEKGGYIFLKELLQMLESGSRPTGGVGNIESGILSFGGTHVSSDGYIDTSKAKYIPIEYHQKNLTTTTKINDLLLVKDGATTGKIAIIQKLEHESQNINEHVFLMRLKNNVNPIYLLSYLKSSFGNMQIKREITGATVTGLTKDVVNSLKIPLPPIEKQNQIAEHISKIRDQAKQLQTEAKNGLEQAKHEVEIMILKR